MYIPKTKIIATLGPGSNTETMLRKMFVNGLDIVRLNFSHGTHAGHLHRIRLVRALNRRMGRAVGLMQDLEGFRIRIGRFRNGKTPSLFFLNQPACPPSDRSGPTSDG